MKFWGIFRFEVVYHLRRVSTSVYFVALLALATSITLAFVDNARKEAFYFNAPIIIAAVTVLTSLFGLLVAAALASDAATRDLHTRMTPLHYSVPITKGEYLGGRFLGALAVYVLMLLVVVPLAFALVTQLPGLEPELIGPWRLDAYLSAYALFAWPNAVVAIALLFAGGVLSRRALTSYGVAVFLFMLSNVAKELVAVEAGRWTLAMHLDPAGFTGTSALWRSWTTFQKNNLLVAAEGALLSSRLLWLGIAVGALALTYARFRFAHHVSGRGEGQQASFIGQFWPRGFAAAKATPAPEAPSWSFATSMPLASPTLGTRVAQVLGIAWRSFREIIGSRAAWTLPLLAVLLVVAGPELLEGELGTPSLPTTARLTNLTGHQLLSLLVAALTTLFAGQLVWQERDAGLSELTDAAPVPDGAVYLGKLLGLAGLLVALQGVVMAAGVFIQLSLDYHHLEAGLYLRILFGLYLPNQLLFAVVALVGHVLVRDKYVGHLMVFLLYLYTAFARELGIGHPLLVFGADPGWRYTEMGGFGAFIGPVLWFKAYWASWALLLGLLLMLFWIRGREPGLRWRMRLARRRFTRGAAVVAAGGTGLVLLLGGFIFYNTNVRNRYQSEAARTERRAAYERRFGRYRELPQPILTGTKLQVELYPQRGQAQVQGTYQLVNQTTTAIESIHMVFPVPAKACALRCDRPARLVLADEAFGYHILALGQPLQPGDTLRLHFEQRLGTEGFAGNAGSPAVAPNGTWLENDWLPAVGYQSSRELQDAGARRQHRLPARPAVRSLHDVAARRDQRGRERIAFEAVIGTDEGQTAVAPGTLRRTWTAPGRRYFHYVAAAPIRNIYALFSARYAVREIRWRNLPIRVFYHPGHSQNIGCLLRSAQASLACYTREFGPYPFDQLTLVETPGANSSLRLTAYPGTIMYTESFALVNPREEQRHLDLPFAVLAHEMAHQWWGHQVVPADVEGAPVLSESLAWYSAMLVVEEAKGREHLGRLLHMMRREYLTPRASAAVPLLRATDHFDVYRKGPFAMHALRGYLGKASINAALRQLLRHHGAGKLPLPVSLDLYRELQAVTPDSFGYLLPDLFAKNAFWELTATSARLEPAAAGTWRVRFTIKANKVAVDSLGTETAVPLNDYVEIGLYSTAASEEPGQPLYLQQHRIHAGTQTITLTVPKRPKSAGIDPRQLLVDRNMDDNYAQITEAKATSTSARVVSYQQTTQ